jgi:hypothetical protein
MDSNPELFTRREEKASAAREAIPLEIAIDIQTKLPFLMAPAQILE